MMARQPEVPNLILVAIADFSRAQKLWPASDF